MNRGKTASIFNSDINEERVLNEEIEDFLEERESEKEEYELIQSFRKFTGYDEKLLYSDQ